MRRKKIQLLYITTGLVVFLIICNSCGHNSRYTNRGVLKNITGIELPPFKIVKDTLLGESLFLGDYDRKCEIEFKEIPSENFFLLLDSICTIHYNVHDKSITNESNWNKVTKGDTITYNYYNMWGNSYPAPKGESDDEDRTLSIQITKGRKKATINYGTW